MGGVVFVTASILNTQERKRQLSDHAFNYSENEKSKKLKQDHTHKQPQSRMEAMLFQLSSQFTRMNEKMNKRNDDLEKNFEKQISDKLCEKPSTIIDNKIKDKISEVKTEMKSDIDEMKTQIQDVKTQVTEQNNSKPKHEASRNKFIIKKLEQSEQEKDDLTATKH